MDKSDKERLKRMLQEASEHNSARPLERIYITLGCGCELDYNGSTEGAPFKGQILYCYHHMQETKVASVNVRRG